VAGGRHALDARTVCVAPPTVILTRPAGRNDALERGLRPHGFRVVVEPLVEIEPIETGPVDVAGYRWIVLTSATGARLLRGRMRGATPQVAAIGRATAEAWGAPVDLVPAVATQEGLLAELPRPAGAVLFAGAEGARPLLADELDADVVALYRTKERRPAAPLQGDLVVLASASAARSFARLGLAIPAVSIGPETTRQASEEGIRVVAEAAVPSVHGLVAAVLRAAR
jgi:uroporphyrinogen-III synthase